MLMLFNIFRLQCKQIDSDLSAGRLFLPRGETSQTVSTGARGFLSGNSGEFSLNF